MYIPLLVSAPFALTLNPFVVDEPPVSPIAQTFKPILSIFPPDAPVTL